MSHFIICLAVPDLSQCLNNILPVKYDSTLVVKCYVPGNPNPDVKCELLGENNVALRSEGKIVYSFHVNYHQIVTSKEESYLLVGSVFMSLFNILEKNKNTFASNGKQQGLMKRIPLDTSNSLGNIRLINY